MTYDIYLTQASDEAKKELAKLFEMCPCCDFEGVAWLNPYAVNGEITIHGIGYTSEDDDLIKPTPEKECRYCVHESLQHGDTVILTPDVNEFISLINKYLK